MKGGRLFCITLGLMMLCSSGWTQDNPTVNGLFSDHMVLQRDMPVPVWGTAKPGDKITVSFAGQQKTGEVAGDGTWKVVLDPMPACTTGSTLAVTCHLSPVTCHLQDVLVGKGLIIGKKNGEEQMQEVPSEKLGCFALAIADPANPKGLKWSWADAVIDGDTVVVSSPDIPNPVAARYACICNPIGNKLYNKEGLPASPFRTDN